MSLEINLIEGERGKLHVTSDDARTEHAVIFGRGRKVLNMDEMFEAVLVGNNTVRILSGVLYNNGMFIRIDREDYKEVNIENGLNGTYRNDFICIRYERNIQTHIESACLVVKKGTASENTATDPTYTEGNILDFDTVDEFPLYRVRLDGIHPILEPMFEVADAMDNIELYRKVQHQQQVDASMQQQLAAHQQDDRNPHRATKEQVGLGNVDNTSDMNKPVSNLQEEYIKGIENSLRSDINDVARAAELALNKASNHIADKNNTHGVTKAQVGLDKVDNTADLDKPISKATKKVLDALESNKADKLIDIDKELVFTKSNIIKSSSNIVFNDIAYGNGIFHAVSYYGCFYSYDGINWKFSNDDAYPDETIVYGNGKFLHFYGDGFTGFGYSENGTSWSEGYSLPDNAIIQSVDFGNGVFVAVGSVNGQKCCITSSNGIDWMLACYSDYYGNKIRYLEHTFFMLGDNKIASSLYGEVDNLYTFADYSDFDFKDIAYGDETYVVIGTHKDGMHGTTIFRTTDFSTLTPCIENIPELRSIIYVNGTFIAVGENGTFYYSTDAINWKQGDCLIDACSIACSDDKLVVVGNSQYASYISLDDIGKQKTVEEAINDLQNQVNKAASLKNYIIKQEVMSDAFTVKGNSAYSGSIQFDPVEGYTPTLMKTDVDHDPIFCSQSYITFENGSYALYYILRNVLPEESICTVMSTILWIRNI